MIAALEVSPTMARCVSRSLLLLYRSLFKVSALVHLLYKRPLELSPRPMPSVKPAPSATTFLSAPQISTPGTSGTIATWKRGSLNTCYGCYYYHYCYYYHSYYYYYYYWKSGSVKTVKKNQKKQTVCKSFPLASIL